jgi:cellulose synthase/poly-beta-1,6-N-acetylglucosamine synthase-like glycosyltransferase
MTHWFSLLFVLLFAPTWLASTYLFWLALLSRRETARPYGTPAMKFDIIVPAHDEELCIERTIRSLEGIDYPARLRRIHVIADNCSDLTGELARNAGAEVFVRTEPTRRGKGHALTLAFEQSANRGWADALVVIDADTQVSSNLLSAFEGRLATGASAVQAEYGVLNPGDGWRTRLMTIALATFHRLRSSARGRLGLSVGLRGNGMAFSTDLVREVPHAAYSIVEDLEYGLRLGEAGHRVHYVGEAEVRGEMPASEQASRSQRRRWEGGRLAIARRHGFRLLWLGIRRRDPVVVDLAIDLFVPPLTYLIAAAGLGTLLAAAAVAWHLVSAPVLAPVLTTDLFLAVYVGRGWRLSGVGWRGLWDLLFAPAYMVWKLGLWLHRPATHSDDWVRTARAGKAP